jgi:hypothetical protein
MLFLPYEYSILFVHCLPIADHTTNVLAAINTLVIAGGRGLRHIRNPPELLHRG